MRTVAGANPQTLTPIPSKSLYDGYKPAPITDDEINTLFDKAVNRGSINQHEEQQLLNLICQHQLSHVQLQNLVKKISGCSELPSLQRQYWLQVIFTFNSNLPEECVKQHSLDKHVQVAVEQHHGFHLLGKFISSPVPEYCIYILNNRAHWDEHFFLYAALRFCFALPANFAQISIDTFVAGVQYLLAANFGLVYLLLADIIKPFSLSSRQQLAKFLAKALSLRVELSDDQVALLTVTAYVEYTGRDMQLSDDFIRSGVKGYLALPYGKLRRMEQPRRVLSQPNMAATDAAPIVQPTAPRPAATGEGVTTQPPAKKARTASPETEASLATVQQQMTGLYRLFTDIRTGIAAQEARHQAQVEALQAQVRVLQTEMQSLRGQSDSSSTAENGMSLTK